MSPPPHSFCIVVFVVEGAGGAAADGGTRIDCHSFCRCMWIRRAEMRTVEDTRPTKLQVDR